MCICRRNTLFNIPKIYQFLPAEFSINVKVINSTAHLAFLPFLIIQTEMTADCLPNLLSTRNNMYCLIIELSKLNLHECN